MPDPTSPDLTPPEPARATGFRAPVEYYSSPEPEVRPIVPRGIALGCGIASLVILVVLFAGGALIAHYGMGQLMDPLLGMMTDEMGSMYTKDVTTETRKELDGELTRLRENIRSGKVPVAALDPVMSSLRKAIGDQKITPEEAHKLAGQVHDLNTTPPKSPQKKK